MHLYLVGINHNDPGQPEALEGWLQRTSVSEEAKPSFIAVEWGKVAHERVVIARAEFAGMARERWGDAAAEVIEALARTMGFEGDAHRRIWPEIEPIWLDDGRDLDANARFNLEMYAEGRFGIYNGWLEGPPPGWCCGPDSRGPRLAGESGQPTVGGNRVRRRLGGDPPKSDR